MTFDPPVALKDRENGEGAAPCPFMKVSNANIFCLTNPLCFCFSLYQTTSPW